MEIAAREEGLSKVETEAAELRSSLLEAQVENERVMEALRRAGEDKHAQSAASITLEVCRHDCIMGVELGQRPEV